MVCVLEGPRAPCSVPEPTAPRAQGAEVGQDVPPKLVALPFSQILLCVRCQKPVLATTNAPHAGPGPRGTDTGTGSFDATGVSSTGRLDAFPRRHRAVTLRSATPKRENPSLAHSGRGPRAAARPGGGAGRPGTQPTNPAPHPTSLGAPDGPAWPVFRGARLSLIS